MRRWLSLGLCAIIGCATGSPAATAEVADPRPVAATAPDATAPPASTPTPAETSAAPPREQSVKPGINEAWKSDDIDPLVARLEAESREIFVHRERLVEVVKPRPGSVVADIGAGSGFLTLLLAEAVGPQGKVLAVDINRTMLDQVTKRAEAEKLGNVDTLLSPEDSTPLEPESVDLVFMCDAYHHFEYPRSTMASIHAALRPGGELVLVDFERIPGETKPRMLEHVRAGKAVFRQEILDAGFELVREHDVPQLEENYVLRFRKVARP